MTWSQTTFTLPLKSRGTYLITDVVGKEVSQISEYKVGLLNLFLQHTSCALGLNEDVDENVRSDMSDALDRIAPEDKIGGMYRHAEEGPDDMPAHIKTALIGSSITIPIKDGKLATGKYQGIWYLEFRASQRDRKVVATIQGEVSESKE
ncbi:uncharacterized protein K441DRAFT_610027 [Cenococcum geophilum 1.58]|uniref:uncharacterized protein n=1 Tax=Cenococcum geophilum 1.58 TaxID=794803 RepID=UPI00358F575E|nr:hypothetical protein K441DRAFT_610027 [Cenococcum geophilum 1.58]